MIFGEHLFSWSIGGSIWHRRTEAIEKELKKHNIKAKVHRHHIYDVEYYVLTLDTSKKHISESDVANALNIPKEWVGFVHINLENCYKIFWIKEDEFNAKYCNDDGEIVFKKSFKLTDYPFEESFNTLCPISNQLSEQGIVVDKIGIWEDYLMIQIEYDECITYTEICDALKCSTELIEVLETHRTYVIKRWDE